MTLGELLTCLSPTPTIPTLVASVATQRVQGVVQDSRHVVPGSVFVARRGATVDGHRFIPQAIAQGAIAIVGEGMDTSKGQPHTQTLAVPYICVRDDKRALAELAAAFHGHPSRQLMTFGVTGTDGKTTTATMLQHLLMTRYSTGLLSTAGNRLNQEPLSSNTHHTTYTTPEASDMQAYLAQFVEAGVTHAVIESSSHGFAMQRLHEVDYDVGIVTNLSPEHLEYHGSLEAYREAKACLVQRARCSILNADDPHYTYFAAQATGQLVSYGIHQPADWQAQAVSRTSSGFRFVLHSPYGQHPVTLPMLGSYNIANALSALAAAAQTDIPLASLIARLATFEGVAGRMHLVQLEPFAVVVDFAHTPPALQQVLENLRQQCRARLIVLTGATGERDPSKREPMGRIAAELADIAIFSEEGSRSEPTASILASFVAGARAVGASEGQNMFCIPDRREAIAHAIGLAEAGDIVVLCGKGHESQLDRIGQTLAWNEVDEAKQALAKRRDQRQNA